MALFINCQHLNWAEMLAFRLSNLSSNVFECRGYYVMHGYTPNNTYVVGSHLTLTAADNGARLHTEAGIYLFILIIVGAILTPLTIGLLRYNKRRRAAAINRVRSRPYAVLSGSTSTPAYPSHGGGDNGPTTSYNRDGPTHSRDDWAGEKDYLGRHGNSEGDSYSGYK